MAIPQSRLDTTLGISKGSCKRKDIEHCPTLSESLPQVGSRSREKTLACLLVYCPSKWISQLIAEDLCAVSFARVASISLNSLFCCHKVYAFLSIACTQSEPPRVPVSCWYFCLVQQQNGNLVWVSHLKRDVLPDFIRQI